MSAATTSTTCCTTAYAPTVTRRCSPASAFLAPRTARSSFKDASSRAAHQRRVVHKVSAAGSRSESGVSASTSGSSLADLKAAVIRSVAGTNRGKNTTAEQRAEILSSIRALEAANPTPRPASSPLLSARWALLYNGPGDEQQDASPTRAGSLEGPLLAAIKPFTANAVRSKGIVQTIKAEEGYVENLAEFVVFGVLNGYLNILGTVERSPPGAGWGDGTRGDVAFTAFVVKLGLAKLTIPFKWFRVTPTGWVETTYLDEEMRVGRGDKGSVFVTARQK